MKNYTKRQSNILSILDSILEFEKQRNFVDNAREHLSGESFSVHYLKLLKETIEEEFSLPKS